MTNLEIINLLQRITGITAFALITLQVFLSTDRKYLRFHMISGIFAYTFILLHPLLFVIYRYFLSGEIDPFYVFVDFCVMCGNNKYEWFLSLGRFAFYIFTIAVIVAKYKQSLASFSGRNGFLLFGKKVDQWLAVNWRKLHMLNYLAFIFVSAHSINVGTDVTKPWFMIFFWFCQAIFMYAVVKRLREVYLNFKKFLPQVK
ncbi:MAG: hypothetical protein QY322_01205 [bacterium]|nr:MAG: hypothetical protein QY322_01205 [bacterium]